MIIIRWRTIIVTSISILIFGITVSIIFSVKSFASKENHELEVTGENHEKYISEEQIRNLIESEGMKDNYYFGGLSYEIVNLDNDSELEIVAKTIGGVHLGDFFIFDKKEDGSYYLITEKKWHIDNWDFSNPKASPIEFGNKKIFEVINRTGGTGLDIYEVYLWYIDQGEFTQVWKGILKDREYYRNDYVLEIGNYLINDDTNQLYAWNSRYNYQRDDVIINEFLGTNTMIYEFDGTKFVLDQETGYLK